MDVLDLLEGRIDSLLGELAALKTENSGLRARLDGIEDTGIEKAALEQALQEEKQIKEQVLSRIDALLARLTETDKE